MRNNLIIILAITFLFTALGGVKSGTFTQNLACPLSGCVKYENGQGVGSGKNVYVYESPTHYIGYDATDASSIYQWWFYPPFHVYKVKCSFGQYSGETIIDDTLYESTWVDITVHYTPSDTTK
ncbi:MAG TPA: hypothetical protein VF399_02085 [bacterium]|jgi:hypothetical protein